MLFKHKYDRIIDVEKSEKQFKKSLEEEPLEKKDIPAMIMAAVIVFLPAIIVVIGIFLLIIWLFFFR